MTLACRSAYPLLSQVLKDVDAADVDLGMHLRTRYKTPYEALRTATAEVKLVLGIEHVCNCIYVLGPSAKSPKAKAGLIRELRQKLSKADLTSQVPAELMLKASRI